MTDRDFKLLVREYFQLIDKWKKSRYIYKEEYAQDLEKQEKQIRKELARFTQQEIEELPFTTNDNEK